MSDLKEKIIKEIKKVYDPEIPVNIYELGLIYKIDIDEKNNVKVDMTLTSPNCPVAESLPVEIQEKIESLDYVDTATIEITWDPKWTQEMMSEEAIKYVRNLKINEFQYHRYQYKYFYRYYFSLLILKIKNIYYYY